MTRCGSTASSSPCMAELLFREWSGWYVGRDDSQPRPMHFAAAAMQDAAGRCPRPARMAVARAPAVRDFRYALQSLDAPMRDTYLRIVHMFEQAQAGHLRARGAGSTLSYEIVGPTTDPSSASAVTLLCVHGNSSHRGVWRLVVR